MLFLALFTHILIFLAILKVTNFKRNYFNPVYFWIYANYFYFYILWFLWIFIDYDYVLNFQTGYYITLLHGIGLLMGIIYTSINKGNFLVNSIFKVLPEIRLIYFKVRVLVSIFVLFFILLLFIMFKVFGTLNPVEVLIEIESTKQLGLIYHDKLIYFIKPLQTFLILIYCLIIIKSYLENKFYFIPITLIMFMFLSLAFGSKSMVIYPLFYWLIIRHNYFKRIKLKYVAFFGFISLICVPFLELLRQNMLDKLYTQGFNVLIHTLVGRINMELYLTKFFELGFDKLDYPFTLYHFFLYFFPRTLLENLGINDKPIPFGLAYTRYVTERPDVFMTVAGGGIAEWIHNFSIFENIYIVYFSVILAGFVSGLINGFLFRVTKYTVRKFKFVHFIVILIGIHIGTLFEFGFSFAVGTIENFLVLILQVFIINSIITLLRIKGKS